jgi:SnoaL-like polyketide cyclase
MNKSGASAKDVAQEFYVSYNKKDLDASWESYISASLVNHAMGGAYDGEFFGIPATGRTASLTCISVDRIQDGKIAEHWADLDFIGFMQRLAGEFPSPAIAAAEGSGD